MLNKVMADSLIDTIRVSAVAWLLLVIDDVRAYVALIMLVSIANFACGLWAAKVSKEKYSHKKAFSAFVEFGTAMCVIFLTSATCRLLDDQADCGFLLKIIASLFALCYAKNIFRNLKITQPDNEFILMLDAIINTKYLDIKQKIKDGTLFGTRANKLKDSSGSGDKQHS